jgi:hypothetical protein
LIEGVGGLIVGVEQPLDAVAEGFGIAKAIEAGGAFGGVGEGEGFVENLFLAIGRFGHSMRRVIYHTVRDSARKRIREFWEEGDFDANGATDINADCDNWLSFFAICFFVFMKSFGRERFS